MDKDQFLRAEMTALNKPVHVIVPPDVAWELLKDDEQARKTYLRMAEGGIKKASGLPELLISRLRSLLGLVVNGEITTPANAAEEIELVLNGTRSGNKPLIKVRDLERSSLARAADALEEAAAALREHEAR